MVLSMLNPEVGSPENKELIFF